MKFEVHIKATESDQLVLDVLKAECSLSKTELKTVMQKGAVWVTNSKTTQRVRRASAKLNAADEAHLYFDQSVLAQEPEAPTLVFEQGDYSIWYKPSGMFCQGSKWGDHCTINRWVETHSETQKLAFIVHRLDRATSGLIILAYKKKTAAYFAELFQKRMVDKRYQAIVEKEFPEALSLDMDIDGKKAISHARQISYNEQRDCSLVEVAIETGRKHQIRRHLSGAGYPIVGDRLYGNATEASENLRLVSCYLAFICPVDREKKQFLLPEEFELKL